MVKHGLCKCCMDVWVERVSACDSCSRLVCEDCLAHVGPAFNIPEGWLCCQCRGDNHEEPTNADLDDWKGDDSYHTRKDEGKLG